MLEELSEIYRTLAHDPPIFNTFDGGQLHTLWSIKDWIFGLSISYDRDSRADFGTVTYGFYTSRSIATLLDAMGVEFRAVMPN